MTTNTDTNPDDSVLADWFDEFVEDVLEGRATDLDSRIERRPDLSDQITQSYLLAHRLAGRRLPITPRIDGYEIIRELGRGGMGAVFLAKHAKLGRLVALKVMPTTFGLSDRARVRFMQEVRALATVTDDHIVRVHNVISNDEALAFEMEYVDGPTLRAVVDRIRKRGRDATLSDVVAALGEGAQRPPERTLLQWSVRIVATIARALGKVHATGLVHRDVKPSNILLRRDGTPLLADFGLVRETASSVTRTEAFVGTLAYASPEQLRTDGSDVDARSDIYALGATLWELVVGTPPQEGRSAVEVLRMIETRGAPRLRQRIPAAPRDLETILEKALDPDPDRRYPTADALADDLELLLRWQPIKARPPGPIGRVSRVVRRHRGVLLAASLGAAAVVLTVVGALFVASESSRRAERVDTLVRAAREQLVSAPLRDRSWRVLAAGTSLHSERLTSVTSAPSDDLTGALRTYDAALAIDPDRPDVRIERTVVAVAAGLPAVDTGILPSRTRASAETLARGSLRFSLDDRDLADATPEDRFALGLLSFLICDVSACEAAWSGLEGTDSDSPLRDAGLGILQAMDGWPERAYPRLLQAARSLPNNATLAVTLADVAVGIGERDAAARWLARARELGASDADLAPAAIDLALANGDVEGARRHATEGPPNSSRVALARARTELFAAETDHALATLVEVVRRAPGLVRARLLAARIAATTRTNPTLLRQIEWVVDADFCANRSPGAFRDAVEILQIGGLPGLVAGARARRGAERGPASRGFVEASFGRSPFEDPLAIELLLTRRSATRRNPLSIPSDGSAPIARALATTADTCVTMPELLHGLGPVAQLTTIVAALEVRGAWSTIVRDVLTPFRSDAAGVAAARALRRWDGDAAGDVLAFVDVLDDLDGDGLDDVIAFQLQEQPDHERYSRVFSSRTGDVLLEFRGPGVGYVATSLGDVDGDGRREIARTDLEPGSTPQRAQSLVNVVSGADGSVLRAFRGRADDSQFGTSLARLPDLDGDGIDDLAIGSSAGLAGAGYVTVFSVGTGATIATVNGRAGISFGMSLAVVPDQDGDGTVELAIGAPAANNGEGLVVFVSPRDGRTLREQHGDARFTMFGWCLDARGDFDGDGVADLAIGIPFRDQRSGGATILSGRDGSRIGDVMGPNSGDSAGMTIDVCDFDGDAVPDLLLAAPVSARHGKDSGVVYVFSGATLRTEHTARLAAVYDRSGPGDQLGMTAGVIPDFFGPGRGALVVGHGGGKARAGAIEIVDPFPASR